MEYLDFFGRITICFLLGIAIGLERQCRRRIAGIRTITLVCLGSFLFVSLSMLTINNDITRVAAQVVSGIGFLGAGVILRDGTNIRGLNTAATLWCSAAIGTLTALGLIVEAIIGVLYILLTNLFLRYISRKLMKKASSYHPENYSLTILCTEEKEMIVKNMLIQKLKTQQSGIKNFTTKKIDGQIKIEALLQILTSSSENIDSMINKICIEPGVSSVEFNKLGNYTDDDEDDYEVK